MGKVRAECDRYGMPLIVWSYPRGSAVEAKGGRDSLSWPGHLDRGLRGRLADELANIVKLNVPKFRDLRNEDSPAPYRKLYEEWKELPVLADRPGDESEAYRLALESKRVQKGRGAMHCLREAWSAQSTYPVGKA